jgi:hypothetical protein
LPSLLDDTTASRSIYTLAQMQARVRTDLGLTDSSLLTDDNIEDWLNEAQTEIALTLRWYRVHDIMGTVSGTKEYALPIPAAGRCIQIEEVRYDDEQMEVVSLDQLLRYDWNYTQAGNGRPQFYYVRGATGFGLHQTPDTTDADILTVVYVGLPPQVTAPNELFYVPPGGDRALLIYAKMLASEKDMYGEGARRAQMYAQQWEQELVKLKRQVDQGAERESVALGSDAMAGPSRQKVPLHTTVGQ